MEKKYRNTIVIGDIHGMLDEFKQLLHKVDYNPKLDLCICAGDLVDRGPKSSEVVDLAMKNNMIVTIGNHDDYYIRYYKHEIKRKHYKEYKNPMRLSEQKKPIWNSLSKKHLQFLISQPYIYPLVNYNSIIVHAGVLPNKPLYHQHKSTCLYMRYVNKDTYKMLHLGPDHSQPKNSVHWTELHHGSVNVIFGHHVLSLGEPVILTNLNGGKTIGIDTGACFGGNLTAIVFSENNINGSIVSVKANKKFEEYKL